MGGGSGEPQDRPAQLAWARAAGRTPLSAAEATLSPQPSAPAAPEGRRWRAPEASYRLQLHAGFTLLDAARVVPYLAQLGISHLYLSPITAAMPGSQHGYDVRSHSQVNGEIGGLTGLYALHDALVEADMGLITDIVPNHVGIGGDNPWWRDVLRHGQASRYGPYFDIDWLGHPQLPAGILVVPILGQPFGAALEAGELRLGLDAGEIVLRYFENVLPLAPETYPEIVGLPPADLPARLRSASAFSDYVDIIDSLRRTDPGQAEQQLGRWRELLSSEPELTSYVGGVLEDLNGQPGDPASFDRLEALLGRQHYRLANWRVAGEEINYRRFFDVNGLAGIRVEREDVFDDVHRLLFQLVRRGIVTGVRVDHIDGLYDPAGYLSRLRAGLDEAVGDVGPYHVPIYVEKILEEGEGLRHDWPVDGTTGYELLSHADRLLIDSDGVAELNRAYAEMVRFQPRLDRTAYRARLQVAEESFAGELNVLGLQLYRLAQRHRRSRDITLRSLRDAVGHALACFPVYRTYGPGDGAELIERALELARLREPGLSEDAARFLRDVMLGEEGLEPEDEALRTHFRRRFEQLSGPIMAKGLEDTTFYRYNRLLSLNEVGADPGQPGIAPAELHRWLAARARHWPHAMLASSTHDTKRSEDVRARLDVLSELGAEWRREVLRWQRLNERHHRHVQGEPSPDPNAEYYLYQVLLGTWPPAGPDGEYRERMRAHFQKALREAKLDTSWVRPNEAYEAACLGFVDAVLDPRKAGAFLRRISALSERIRPAAACNSLSALALKATAPGFPDFYQGSEVTTDSVTDPDNRRPVDFAALEAAAARLPRLAPPMVDTGAKPWLTRRLLEIRGRYREVMSDGDFTPLEASGRQGRHVFGFVREHGDTSIAVVVTRLALRIATSEGIPAEVWGDTRITMPGAGPWRCLLAEGSVDGADPVACSRLLSPFPVAVLVREG